MSGDGSVCAGSNVDHPAHYGQASVECIDAMVATQGAGAVYQFCVCNAFKYLWRRNRKGGHEDVEKALWYLKEASRLRDGEGYGKE